MADLQDGVGVQSDISRNISISPIVIPKRAVLMFGAKWGTLFVIFLQVTHLKTSFNITLLTIFQTLHYSEKCSLIAIKGEEVVLSFIQPYLPKYLIQLNVS